MVLYEVTFFYYIHIHMQIYIYINAYEWSYYAWLLSYIIYISIYVYESSYPIMLGYYLIFCGLFCIFLLILVFCFSENPNKYVVQLIWLEF